LWKDRYTLSEYQKLMHTRAYKRKNLTAMASVGAENDDNGKMGENETIEGNGESNSNEVKKGVDGNGNGNGGTGAIVANVDQIDGETALAAYPNLPSGDMSFNLLWTWRHSTINHQYLHIFQKVNHFQRSGHLTRKDALSKNILRFVKQFAQHDQNIIVKNQKLKKLQEQKSLIDPNDIENVQKIDKMVVKLTGEKTKKSLKDVKGEKLLGHNLEILPHSYVFPLDLKQFTEEYHTRQRSCRECGGSGRVPKTEEEKKNCFGKERKS